MTDSVAVGTAAGLTANRIEALLSARLFLEPQLAEDRIYFISNLSGHLSLHVMDAAGGVPEPLLPPQLALQNPELIIGYSFYVLPRLGQIVVMIDQDGDENYEPFIVPIEGGFPEPLAEESFSRHRSSLLDVDVETSTAYFSVQSREEQMISALRVDLDSRASETIGQSMYGAYVAAWTPDHSRIVLADGYTRATSCCTRSMRTGIVRCSTARRSTSERQVASIRCPASALLRPGSRRLTPP
jgi:hypothetical protein